MKPAFSVVLLTTLIGAGQGLLTAIVLAQYLYAIGYLPENETPAYYAAGTALAIALMAAGLGSSFFHLAHPERAWRAVTRWRTSWLSKEVVVLPCVIGLAGFYGLIHLAEWRLGGWDPVLLTIGGGRPIPLSLAIGGVAVAGAFVLYVCTGMIYASIKFIQEWAHWLTAVNYTVLGLASGFTLGAAHAAIVASPFTAGLAQGALALTALGLVTRSWAVWRNQRIRPISSLRTAIGQHHTVIRQLTQGFTAGSFNTREFFHGADPVLVARAHFYFLPIGFAIPLLLVTAGWLGGSPTAIAFAFAVQYGGLLIERWAFFAQGRHPQNLYYQRAG